MNVVGGIIPFAAEGVIEEQALSREAVQGQGRSWSTRLTTLADAARNRDQQR